MKKIMVIMLLLVVAIACKKEDEKEPLVITRVEYRIDSSVDNAIVKYIGPKGEDNIDYISDDSTWVYTFDWVKDLDTIGFQIKDYITWTHYRIVVNTDTVVAYTGPVPEGGYAGWYKVYYAIPKE